MSKRHRIIISEHEVYVPTAVDRLERMEGTIEALELLARGLREEGDMVGYVGKGLFALAVGLSEELAALNAGLTKYSHESGVAVLAAECPIPYRKQSG